MSSCSFGSQRDIANTAMWQILYQILALIVSDWNGEKMLKSVIRKKRYHVWLTFLAGGIYMITLKSIHTFD